MRKHRIVIAFALLSIVLSGCSNIHQNSVQNDDVNDIILQLSDFYQNQDRTALSITVVPQIMSLNNIPDYVWIYMTNNSQECIMVGYGGSIDFFDGENWVDVTVWEINGVPIIISGSGHNLFPRATWERGSVLASIISEPVAGKYRFRYTTNYPEHIYAIFFIIE
ncbi:MAG: hypothetical protein FWE33_02270 [Defluviitaleaceae bacterium]|nr:hypothetical protein [Defluviitaleaceae bacterium]